MKKIILLIFVLESSFGTAQAAWYDPRDIVKDTITKVSSAINQKVDEVQNNIRNNVNQAYDRLKAKVNDLYNDLSSTMESHWDKRYDYAKQLDQKIVPKFSATDTLQSGAQFINKGLKFFGYESQLLNFLSYSNLGAISLGVAVGWFIYNNWDKILKLGLDLGIKTGSMTLSGFVKVGGYIIEKIKNLRSSSPTQTTEDINKIIGQATVQVLEEQGILIEDKTKSPEERKEINQELTKMASSSLPVAIKNYIVSLPKQALDKAFSAAGSVKDYVVAVPKKIWRGASSAGNYASGKAWEAAEWFKAKGSSAFRKINPWGTDNTQDTIAAFDPKKILSETLDSQKENETSKLDPMENPSKLSDQEVQKNKLLLHLTLKHPDFQVKESAVAAA